MCAAVAKPSAPLKEIPDVLVDPRTKKRYQRGRFLGKGGFAKCFEITDMETKQVFAGKIVAKSRILKQRQREKMTSEIAIHKSLDNPHIVGFHGSFDDDDFVFVVLELCRQRSLLELHKRRKAVTEPEARYFMMQLLNGCRYLHDNRVIHRDLKLGNIFLSDDMMVKIGDFGLATKITYDGERKMTLCGTPNYIAPEVLLKKGHSFEVDVWALGCILYTLLVGKAPFQTSSKEATYNRIKKNIYTIPWNVNPLAGSLIKRMLRADPSQRPTVAQLQTDEYFTQGYVPTHLPTTCLTLPPHFYIAHSTAAEMRRPFTALNNKGGSEKVEVKDDPAPRVIAGRDVPEGPDCNLTDMLQQITAFLATKPSERPPLLFLNSNDAFQLERSFALDAEDPACIPIFWISNWIDYSDKYGLGYMLCDDSVGVCFNDYTRLMMHADGERLQYIDETNAESYISVCSYPATLTKKVTLLKYFRSYMSEHLLKAGAHMAGRDGDELARLPYLSHWFRTESAIVLHLSNGTVQINFQDHAKLILCPLMAAVTHVDEWQVFRTYKLSLLEEFGCSRELATRMRYAKQMVDKLLSSKGSAALGDEEPNEEPNEKPICVIL